MNKKLGIAVGVFAIALIVNFVVTKSWSTGSTDDKQPDVVGETAPYKNIPFTIAERTVEFNDGYAETEVVPGSTIKLYSHYFGKGLFTDLDGDGVEDITFIVTQYSIGDNTFYYAVAALKTLDGYVGSDGYLLGDRIVPQPTLPSSDPNEPHVVVFSFLDHEPEQEKHEIPKNEKSVRLKINPDTKTWEEVDG